MEFDEYSLETKQPETLYYYCSLDTFLSILKNKSIWLCEIGKSNDSLEQKFFAKCMLDNFDEIIKPCGKRFKEKIKQSKIIDSFQNWLDRYEPDPAWAMCLSVKEDDLSQWRGYGDDAKGMCIGFNFKYLNALNCLYSRKKEDTNENNAYMCLKKIVYNLDDMMKVIKAIFHAYSKDNPPMNDIEKTLMDSFIDSFREPFYKHPAFKDEKEWRIVYSKINPDKQCTFNFKFLNDKLGKNFKLEKVDYRVSKGKLISHIELKMPNLLNAIDKIYIGPKCPSSENDIRRVFQLYFKDELLDIIFKSSAYSYQ